MKLFARRPGTSLPAKLNRAQHDRATAHRLLDRYRNGLELQPALVDWALRMTGDKA